MIMLKGRDDMDAAINMFITFFDGKDVLVEVNAPLIKISKRCTLVQHNELDMLLESDDATVRINLDRVREFHFTSKGRVHLYNLLSQSDDCITVTPVDGKGKKIKNMHLHWGD